MKHMLKKIAGTTLVKLIGALASLAILSMNARVLGPHGVGIISLVVVGVAIIQNISSLIGGSALVYLTPRYDNFHIYILSTAWGLIASALGAVILSTAHMIPHEHTFDVFFLSLLASQINANQMLLLGKENVRAFNFSNLLQSLLSVGALYYFFNHAGVRSQLGFIYSLYIAFGLTFLSSFVLVFPRLKIRAMDNLVPLVRDILRLGGSIQLAGLLQTLNYRFSYFLLRKFFGEGTLGRFDAGVKLSEGIWLAAKSIALIQYAHISNETDKQKALDMTTGLFKISFLITLAGLTALLILPSNWYEAMLGKEFHDVKTVILCLSPGVLAIASGMIFSHYFSGIGKPHYNTIGSGLGLATLIVAGYLIIPRYGLVAAGLATSVSYIAALGYQLTVFRKLSGLGWGAFIPNKTDLGLLNERIRRNQPDA
jgi:O-antigen/teichoic acid export membrane protein